MEQYQRQAKYALNEIEDARYAMPGREAISQDTLHDLPWQRVALSCAMTGWIPK